MKKDKIMVFIPVYNCEKQITRVLSQINDDVLTYVDEIIVVNNLSTDNTVKVTRDYLLKHRELPCKIINNNANFNLGGSHKVAFNYALENDFDYVIVLHGDDKKNVAHCDLLRWDNDLFAVTKSLSRRRRKLFKVRQ